MSKDRPFPDDKTAPERRKNLTEEEIKALQLAGGVAGGMRAGSGTPEPDEDEERLDRDGTDSGKSAA